MKKTISVFILFLALSAGAFSQTKYTAEELKNLALNEDSVEETISFIKAKSSSMASEADRRSILYYLGTLQEHMGQYAEASKSFASAAGIGAGDARNMQKVSTEDLVFAAVAASLNAGDYQTAGAYLSSSISSSENILVSAKVSLYQVWTALCKASNLEETKDSQEILKAYVKMDSMKSVRPQLLFTLWYLTDSDEYKKALKASYGTSPEYRIASGQAELMISPFWFFMPHAEHSYADSAKLAIQESSFSSSNSTSSSGEKAKYLQLGLFKEKANADALVEKAKKKGFYDAHWYTETRSSGTTYYIVVVSENVQGNMSLKLKDAGFENYPLYE